MKSEASLDSATIRASASEAFYKTLLENSFDGVGVIDLDGTVRYYNPAVNRILGYDTVSGIGKNFFELVHPDDKHKCRAAMEKLLTQPSMPVTNIVRFRHEDGTWKHMEAQAVNLCDDRKVAGILINFREITEKLLAQQSLAESEERYRSLIENSFDGITIVNFEGIVKYHSPSLLRILGYHPETGVGKSILDLLHPDDLKVFHEAQDHWKKFRNETFKAAVRFKHKNGLWIALEVRAMDLTDKPGVEGFLINYRDTTESKQLETALLQSEKRYRSLAAASPVGIFTTDPHGNCTFVNERWCEMSGLTYNESMGEGWSKNIHPDDLPRVWQNWAEAAAKKLPSRKEFRLKTNDYKITWVYCQAVPELDASGNVAGYIGSVTDISERVKMEKALHDSEERYRNMVENAQESIFVIDAENEQIIDFNESAERLFGYSRPQLLKLRVRDLSPVLQPDGKTSIEKGVEYSQEVLKKRKLFFEWVHRKSNGKTFTSEVYLSHFPPFDRKLFRGTVIDISAKKEIEKKLREQELQYEHLATVSPVGIFRTDKKGKTIYVNDKWCAITGISSSKAEGEGWMQAIHPDDKSGVQKEWSSSLKQKKISRLEFRFLTPKGTVHWVIGEAVPDFDEHGNFQGFAGSITDITERVLAEQALAKSEQRNEVLLNAIPDMIFRLSKNGTFLDCKVAANFKPHVPPEIFLGKKVNEVLPRPVAALCMKNIRLALQTNEMQTYSYALPESPGNSKFNYYEGRVAAYGSNEVLALIRDITQQKEAEFLLTESEEKWRTLVKSAPQYIATVDKNNRITFINHLRRLKPDQVIGKSIFDLLQSSDLSRGDIKKLLDDGRKNKSNAFEFSMINPLGELMWFNIRASPIKSGETPDGVIIMALDITDRKNAEDEIRLSNIRLKALYQRLETIREEEKKNIAMEIHDELGQELTALKLGMFWLQQYFGRNDGEFDVRQVQQKIKSLIELSAQTIGSARRLAHQLRPVVLDNLGLIPAIEWQVEQVNESGNIRCSFQTNLGNEKFAKDFSVALFRIIQESLTNILKHSKAAKSSLSLHLKKGDLILKIEDNGIGLKQSDLKKSGIIGIFGMKERVQNWNGRFDLSGKPSKGTLLKVIFPLKNILDK